MVTPELKDLINQVLVAILTVVILPTIPLVYKLGKAFIEAKISAIKDQGVKAAVEFAFRRLDFIVANVVAEISQVHPLPPNPTDEDRGKRLNTALMRIREQLVEADEKVLRGSVKDFDRYLTTKVEAARYGQKMEAQAKQIRMVVSRPPTISPK